MVKLCFILHADIIQEIEHLVKPALKISPLGGVAAEGEGLLVGLGRGRGGRAGR
jgi:hypothetical protein